MEGCSAVKAQPHSPLSSIDISSPDSVSSSQLKLNHSSFYHTDGEELKVDRSVPMAIEEACHGSTVYRTFDFARYTIRMTNTMQFHGRVPASVAKRTAFTAMESSKQKQRSFESKTWRLFEK